MTAVEALVIDEHDTGDAPLPSWLANHLQIEWNSDDVDALIYSIDASQSPGIPTLPHLPAEILLHILEYVLVDYVLDWRLICRGFRDAIDGQLLYHLLQRTRLVGYLGPRESPIMRRLSDKAYESLHLVHANLESVERHRDRPHLNQQPDPIWSRTWAVFKIDSRWFETYNFFDEAGDLPSSTDMWNQISYYRTDQGYGSLTWAISLDTAVFDLDLPLEPNRRSFDVSFDIEEGTLRLEWKPMLFRFLKTERALRLLMEKKRQSRFTFSHSEDCLRAVRRQRLHAALDPDSKTDRHIKWSLRLLRPLWGTSGYNDASTLDHVEIDAVGVLLLLRRTAALSKRQTEHLERLATDYKHMTKTMNDLSRAVLDLTGNLIMPAQRDIVYADMSQRHLHESEIPLNPIAWSDELRANIELRVQKWRAQQGLIAQMQGLLITSREALAVPEDAFDVMDSDF